jgi:hypothetical protein
MAKSIDLNPILHVSRIGLKNNIHQATAAVLSTKKL